MRPIDADALEKTLRGWISEHWTEAFTGDDAGSEFMDMIDHEETVDTVQAVRAHWIMHNEDASEDGSDYWADWAEAECSNCGYQYIAVNKAYMYCPNCGAKMDVDNE